MMREHIDSNHLVVSLTEKGREIKITITSTIKKGPRFRS